MSKKWQNVGSMRKGKEGDSYYIKVDQDIKAGSVVRCERPAERIQRLADLGKITQDEANEKIQKVPDFVKFDLILPPPKDDSTF